MYRVLSWCIKEYDISKCTQSYFELIFCGFFVLDSKQKKINNKINKTSLCQLKFPQTLNLMLYI